MKVKVCGMRDALNVSEIAEANPDFMGFIFYPGSVRYVGTDPDRTIFRSVPAGITKVGVFVNEDQEKINKLALEYNLEMVQLHGDETPGYCSQLKNTDFGIIKSFSIASDFDFESLIPYMTFCDYFLFDTKTRKHGGSGRKFNWNKLHDYKLDKPFFLSGGIDPDDVGIITSLVNKSLFAVDINSRFERSPGLKDSGRVKIFIDEIKNDQI